MTLYEKIRKIYPELTDDDFKINGHIVLQNDSDNKGDYIKEWNHPTFPQPSEDELAAV